MHATNLHFSDVPYSHRYLAPNFPTLHFEGVSKRESRGLPTWGSAAARSAAGQLYSPSSSLSPPPPPPPSNRPLPALLQGQEPSQVGRWAQPSPLVFKPSSLREELFKIQCGTLAIVDGWQQLLSINMDSIDFGTDQIWNLWQRGNSVCGAFKASS